MVRQVLGWFAVSVTLLLAVAVLAVFAVFSVTTAGDSMQPTLRTNDRLLLNVFDRGSPERFDVIEVSAPGGTPVVKRVIGLAGDTVQVVGGPQPVVLVTPHGSATTYRVDNPTWPPRIGDATESCCAAGGVAAPEADENAPIVVPSGKLWVLGDNWGGSSDSRAYGFVDADKVGGTTNFRLLPMGRWGRLPDDVRLVRQSD